MTTKVSYGVANIASQAEAEAGTAVDKFMTPQRATQAMTARIATQAEAEAGTDATQFMTPERVIQSMKARGVITQVANPSAASEVDFTPIIPDGIYEVHFWLETTVDSNIGIVTSDDSGVNFNNGTNEWAYRGSLINNSAVQSVYAGNLDYATCDVAGADGAGAVEPKMGTVTVKRLELASTDWVTVEGVTGGTIAGNYVGMTMWNLTSTHANGIDRIRVFPGQGGTITGRIVLVEHPIS